MRYSTDIYNRIVAAKLFIDENYGEPIDLDMLSRQAFLSRFHFHRIFRSIYDYTPHAYLTRRRMERAKELLVGDQTITEVCNAVGFESVGSFSTLFKKEMGTAPTYFRNMAWLRKEQEARQPRKFIPHCFLEQWVDKRE